MNIWSDKIKIKSRIDTLPKHVAGQYWSLAGLCDGPGCEADYVQADEFHGVERVRSIYEQNVKAYPHLNWHLGDLFKVMRKYKGFNPSFVNADLYQKVDTAAPMIARVIDLVQCFDCEMNINFVLACRNQKPQTAEHVIGVLSQYPTIRHAIRRGWGFASFYPYKRKTTWMGTFRFTRAAMRVAA